MVGRRVHDERRTYVRDRSGNLGGSFDVDECMIDADYIEPGQRLDDFGSELP
jgi:hypothetical protein